MPLDLPGYTLTTKAYEGSETVLYRGYRDADRAPVAVKVTRSEYPTARELGRLRREFAILKDLGDLPGVVRAHALEKCGRGLALVMENLGASSLDDIRKARKLELTTTLQIAVSLADTLDSVHRLDVIHKDIKPHNVMIDEATFAPRIIDFGISARLSREAPQATSPASIEGTLAYISPEQTGRMNRTVDLRADLYSLGATLFDVLTGAPPFPATDPLELVHSHIARSPTPPHELSKEVPRALSDVVMRLLAKMPEDRYQSARGLKVDLERCLSQWRKARRIDPFPLGQEDMTRELRVPQKLYGREQDVEALLAAFERVREGATELYLVSGSSGVGKSALVNELHKPIARQGGAFVRGKFDPSSRDVPLAPVAHALRELVLQILSEPASELAMWKDALLDAVGPNGKLLFTLVPELELVIGPQPDTPALGPTEERNRFDLLVQRFLRAFATPARPLALLLDDLQWADPASLRLLSLLLSDPDNQHLLLLGTYRDNEVDAVHPLLATLTEIRKAGAKITEITLRPLELPTVTQLLAETLGKGEHEVSELSTLIFHKTLGNPFFLSQFLGALHEERLLYFDASSSAFTWDLARVREAMATTNVVDLMLSKLSRLGQSTQRVLSLAACIGHEFDLGALSSIHRRSPAETAADLWEALRGGLVLPRGNDYRFLDVSAGVTSTADAEAAIDLQVSYGFLHDRVQEAAYAQIPEEHKEEVHLSIGRLLWARSGEPPRDEDLPEIVRHLHLGARGIVDDAERLSVAGLHLRAGRKARAVTAYKYAANTLAAGIELMGPGGWARDEALCVSLHREAAECAHLAGALEQADALFDVLLPRASSSLDRARIHNLRMNLYGQLGKYSEAVKEGLLGLSYLGVTLPQTPSERQTAFADGLAEVAAALEGQGRRIEDLVNAPVLDDPEKKAALKLLSDLLVLVYVVEPALFPAGIFKLVSISLKHGNSSESPLAYVRYGFMLAGILGRPSEGIAFGRLALALNDKLGNASLIPMLHTVFGNYLYVGEPLRDAIAYFQSGHHASLECGDFSSLANACYNACIFKLGAGYSLDVVRDDIESIIVLMRRIRTDEVVLLVTIQKQMIANLQGRTWSRDSLSDDSFDEDRFAATLSGKEHAHQLFVYNVLKLQIHYLHGDHEAALAAAEKAERVSMSALGMYIMTRFHFYACLSLLSLKPAEASAEEERREAEIARHRARIADLAASCPENFKHQLRLLEAEAARRSGKPDLAMTLYDEAIDLARENDFPQDEALANELCAKMNMTLGRVRAARGYMDDAYLGYLHWGALAKAEDIARDHGHLLPSVVAGRGRRTTQSSTSSTTMTTVMGQLIAGDLREASLIVRATQAIAGEIMLPKVIKRLSKIMLECAGAEHGALLLLRDGRLFVEATFGVDPEVLEVGPSSALETRSDLAQSVALFVARTRESVVLDDARKGGRFAADPHFAEGRVTSMLCLPLLYQGRLTGLLYLENNKAGVAFNATRLELLGLFSSQAAIAIENARMVADVQAANDQVRSVNDRLEAEVKQRTEELCASNRELSATAQHLQIELAQREQAERERAALKDQIMAAQQARLAEMSTPLIPITDAIMVMPLIGTVDAERAAQVMEVALHGAKQHQARVVILDITGIKQIDAYVIQTLLGTATALRLLGARAVLTGVRPEVAQTMVRLETDLEGIVTKGTLQSGIAYALKLSGEVSGERPRWRNAPQSPPIPVARDRVR